MKKLLFSLFAILAFVACSDDGAGVEEDKVIKLETPVANIEPNVNSTVIKFFAAEPWTAEVIITRADDWCTVSPTSGDAGDATITVTTKTNKSPKKRFAQIVIKSGETEETIEVTQEESQEKSKILYTSSDGKIVEPTETIGFDATILSNTYKNGQGVITFSGPITSIGCRAFDACSSLTSITIPESVTSIEWKAFYGCKSLTSVTIPDSVTSIEWDAFEYCI